MPTGRCFKAGVLAATGAALVLTGCSDSDDSAEEAGDDFDAGLKELWSDVKSDFEDIKNDL